jgi:hypothetical protein
MIFDSKHKINRLKLCRNKSITYTLSELFTIQRND